MTARRLRIPRVLADNDTVRCRQRFHSGSQCPVRIRVVEAEQQAYLCSIHFKAKMEWAMANRGQSTKARAWYELHWQPEPSPEPEPNYVVDEMGREVTVQSYWARLLGETTPRAMAYKVGRSGKPQAHKERA